MNHLLIFDFSGTLSLNAPRFGQAETLRRALIASGLARLGICEPAVYWREVVAPTWTEGSTTQQGYRRVMAQRVQSLAGASEAVVWAAVSAFVADYLAHSPIHRVWWPLLRRLRQPWLIATDHYAEATPHIIDQLAALDISAAPVLDASPDAGVQVANSADLGAHKADPRFWRRLWEVVTPPAQLSLVDDFGYNEPAADFYAAQALDRLHQTRLAVGRPVRIFPFFLTQPAPDPLVQAASRFVGSRE